MDIVYCESLLIFVLFHFYISWCQKLFPWAVGYGYLRCYFWHLQYLVFGQVACKQPAYEIDVSVRLSVNILVSRL